MRPRNDTQITCCCFDLETTNLCADFGVILCGVVKPSTAEARVFRSDTLNPRWASRRSDDRHVLKAIVEELSHHDIWIAHNGNKFDVPFLRTRLAKWGLPPLPTKKLIDPLTLARNKLRMSWNSLEKIATFLNCNSKTDVEGDIWLKAALDGNTQAMNKIVTHCIHDVYTLERIVHSLKSYSTNYNSWGSGF
jgi:DNA polymerase III epsilon subunit-like protein